MSDKVLKVVPAPESKASPEATTGAPVSGRVAAFKRANLRMILLVALPSLAVLIGLGI